MAWYNEAGAENDVVISSRVRFARNLTGYPFTDKLSDAGRSEIIEKVTKALAPAELETLDLVAKSPLETGVLAEKRYISPAFANEKKPHTLLLDEAKQLAVMIGEEDHVRIQALRAGLALKEAYAEAVKLDELLDESCDVAYSESVGYLTQNPTDLGTGLRASIVLHLPAMTYASSIGSAARSLAKVGISMRGFLGEGVEADGALYQITNAVTMGMTEEEIIDKLTSVATQLTETERKSRNALKSDSFARLSDRVMRAKALLSGSYILPLSEFISLWSDARLGTVLSILKSPDLVTLDSLLVTAMPASLLSTSTTSSDLPISELDILRAKSLREGLK